MKFSKNTAEQLKLQLFKAGGVVKYQPGGRKKSLNPSDAAEDLIATSYEKQKNKPSKADLLKSKSYYPKLDVTKEILKSLSGPVPFLPLTEPEEQLSKKEQRKANRAKRREDRAKRREDRLNKKYEKKYGKVTEVEDLSLSPTLQPVTTESYYPKLKDGTPENVTVFRTGMGKGDAWQYKKEGNNYFAKKPGTNKWIKVDPNSKAGKAVVKAIAHETAPITKDTAWTKEDFEYQANAKPVVKKEDPKSKEKPKVEAKKPTPITPKEVEVVDDKTVKVPVSIVEEETPVFTSPYEAFVYYEGPVSKQEYERVLNEEIQNQKIRDLKDADYLKRLSKRISERMMKEKEKERI